MEPLAFGSLAHVRILLLPVGNIRRPAYEYWASEIRTFESIPLGDIPADSRDEKARFMPGPLAKGHLHLSYPSHPPPSSRNCLSLFRPSELPLGIIGIATCSQSDSMSSILASFSAALSELSLSRSTFPIASNCFVFEEPDANLDIGDRFPGLIFIPNMLANKRVHIGTLIAGICSHILGEFATVMNTLESPLGNEYLNSALFPMLPPPSELPKSLSTENNYRDSLPPLPSYNSQPELMTSNGNGIFRPKTPSALKRVSTGPGLTPTRHASMPPTPVMTKKRPSAIGAVSSHGRLFKVLGDLFLLSGRHEDASVWYTEALALFKGSQDPVWHASALEGLATIPVVEAWSSVQRMSSSAGDKEPWQDITDKLSQAMALYYKATAPNEPEAAYPLLSFLYIQSVLRQTSLLFATWSAKGWGPLAFSNLLHPGPSPYLPVAQSMNTATDASGVTVTVTSARPGVTYADLERMSVITGITRAQISNTLVQVHGPWLLHLEARERISVLQTVAGMFGTLGYLRKEAYILRELLGSIMDLIVCGREEGSGVRSSASSNTGMPARGGSPSAGFGTVGVRENQRPEGNESVLRIVKHVCRVHGVDLEAVKLIENTASVEEKADGASGSGESIIAVPEQEDDELAESTAEPFGWPELQIGIVREAIAVAEALPDYPSVAQFSLSSLKVLHPVMSQTDQMHLYHTATRALSTAIRRGDRRSVEYWAGHPVSSIEVLPLPFIRLPIEKPISLIASASGHSKVDPILIGAKDPFLYNPRKLLSGQTQNILVQGERFEIVVTLCNPFQFDLQLESVNLSTSGVRIESESIPVIIPANTYHPVTMSAKALESGTLIIRGCKVQAPGGIPREYTLPLSTEEEDEQRLCRRSAVEMESGRSKHTGLDTRPWEKKNKRVSRQNAAAGSSKRARRYIECSVVPEQPLLRIKKTSLTHGAVMLYNGETSTIRLTLENVSSLPVDFLRLTFDDSIIAPAQQALADGELSVFDTYETEYDLIHRPTFKWESTSDQRIIPGGKGTISITCTGKVGCTNGVVHVSYAYIHRHDQGTDNPPDVFHTRQLSYPVVVTVYHMLECHAMDILPLSTVMTYASATMDNEDDDPAVNARRRLMDMEDAADWCLFSIDVRNTYGLPFIVTIDRDQEGTDKASATVLVPPGSTSRIILPIKKILLSEDHVARPIPTLSDRQFVVAKSNLSSTEEKAQRELFWYREKLFNVVRGRWKEAGGSRSGELSLRQQRMTFPMLETLNTETVRVQMSLVYLDDEQESKSVPMDPSASRYLPPPNEFIYLRIRVTNLSPTNLVLTLDLTLEPSQFVLFEGVLSEIPLGHCAHRQSLDAEIPVAFVSEGRFDFSAAIHSLDSTGSSSQVGRGELRAVVASKLT